MLLEVLQGSWDIFAGLADTAETAAFWNSSWRAGRRPEGILTAADTCVSAAEFHTKRTRKPKLIKHSHYGVCMSVHPHSLAVYCTPAAPIHGFSKPSCTLGATHLPRPSFCIACTEAVESALGT